MAQEKRNRILYSFKVKQIIYRLYPPQKVTTKTHLFGHVVYSDEKSTTIIPQKLKKENINPKNFIKLKKRISFKSILYKEFVLLFF